MAEPERTSKETQLKGREEKKMTYKEMKEMVKKMIENGEKLHGWAMEVAVEMALEEKEA